MSKKKVSKAVAQKKPASKSITKTISKSVGKISSQLTKKIAAAVGKTPKKPVSTAKVKTAPKVTKPAAAKKVAEKAPEKVKAVKTPAPQGEENAGNTLLEMARAEMAAVKIGQTPEKVEKASKFKAIKVERGNLADEKAKWQELHKRYGKEKAVNYKMTEIFEPLKPMQHKVLGWGFILTNENDRLEVLFENGIKMLISNYKPN